MFVQWLRNGINGLCGRSTRRSRRPVRSRQLGLERLEDRSVPSATSGLGGQLPAVLHIEGLGHIAVQGLSFQTVPQGDTSQRSQLPQNLALHFSPGPELLHDADSLTFHEALLTSPTKDTGLSYTKYTLKGEGPVSKGTAPVSSFSWSSGEDRPTESVSFGFSNIKVMYTSQGAVSQETVPVSTFGWDIVTQKAS